MAGINNKSGKYFTPLATKIFLTAIFIVLAAIIVALFIAELQFNAAQKIAADYLWEKAETKFEKAMFMDPLNASYPAGFADFLRDISPYRPEGLSLLNKAVLLYDRSLKLDPLNAEYALGQVEAYLMLFLRDETRDKTYLEKALVYFKRALKNDPNGFNTAYETSYRLMAVWQYLSQEDRDLVIERLGYVLKQEPWFRKYIYRRVWLNTNNFCVLQRMTPETLKGQEYLLSYLEGDDLHQFYLQQSQIIKVYKQKENPAALEEEKRKTLEIVNIINNKKGSCSICPPVNVVKADAWYGKSSDGNNEYEAGNMYWNGTIFGVLEAPGGEETITIQAKGSPAEGIYPYMVVAVDGDEISEALIASQDWKDYSFKVKTDAGPKVLSVIFLNDGGNPNANEDRNLYIGQARITKNE